MRARQRFAGQPAQRIPAELPRYRWVALRQPSRCCDIFAMKTWGVSWLE
jgi:hypothetical protein